MSLTTYSRYPLSLKMSPNMDLSSRYPTCSNYYFVKWAGDSISDSRSSIIYLENRIRWITVLYQAPLSFALVNYSLLDSPIRKLTVSLFVWT